MIISLDFLVLHGIGNVIVHNEICISATALWILRFPFVWRKSILRVRSQPIWCFLQNRIKDDFCWTSAKNKARFSRLRSRLCHFTNRLSYSWVVYHDSLVHDSLSITHILWVIGSSIAAILWEQPKGLNHKILKFLLEYIKTEFPSGDQSSAGCTVGQH